MLALSSLGSSLCFLECSVRLHTSYAIVQTHQCLEWREVDMRHKSWRWKEGNPRARRHIHPKICTCVLCRTCLAVVVCEGEGRKALGCSRGAKRQLHLIPSIALVHSPCLFVCFLEHCVSVPADLVVTQTGCGGEEMRGEHSRHHPRVLQRASYVLQLAHLSPLAWLPRRVRMCVGEGKGEGTLVAVFLRALRQSACIVWGGHL